MVKVQCDGCGAPYTVSEKRIPAGGLKMRCPKCGTTFLVASPAAGAAGTPSGPPASQGAVDRDLPAPAAPRPAAAPRPPVKAGLAPGARPPSGEPLVGPAAGDEWDLPEPAVTGLPAVPAARAGKPAARPAAPAAPPPPGPGAKARELGTEADAGAWDELPVVAGVGLPAAKGASTVRTQVGGASPGATMRSLGAPVPPPAKPPIFGRRETAIGLGELGEGDGGGFGEIDIGLPQADEAAPRRGAQSGVEADLPALLEADLPVRAEAALPALAEGGLPALAEGGLPVVSEGGLPVVSEGGLPVVSAGGLPVVSAGGLPVVSAGGLPVVSAGGLPAVSKGNLPAPLPPPAATSGAAVPMDRELPPAPDAAGTAFDGIGLEEEAPDAAAPAGRSDGLELGSAYSGGGDGGESSQVAVGDEFELDAAQRRTEQAGIPVELPTETAAPVAEEAPLVAIERKKSRAFRVAAAAVVVVAIGGGALSLTPLGPYGAYAVSDLVNRSSYEQTLANERTTAQGQLEEDTAAASKAALAACERARAAMPRFAPMTAYTAYLAFAKGLRFGIESQDKALGKQLLEALGDASSDPLITLARAANDGVDGQLARARQAVDGLSSSLPEDVDVAVLAAEIALSAKTIEPGLQLWARAVKIKPSARTLFGLARAQLAAGKLEEAEKSAREALALSKNHAGARTLIASALWRDMAREQEAIKLLEEVTADGPVSAAASTSERATAHARLGEIHLARSRMSQAEKAFAAALALEPESQQALIGNGELYYRSGRFTEAIARFEAALRVNPDSIDAKIGTAKTWIAQERAKDAKDLMQKLVAAGSKDPLVSYWQGQAEEALGNKEAATTAYQRAIKDGGNQSRTVSAYVALANLLTSLGKGDEAKAVLADASQKLPDSAELSVAKGDVALQAGRLDEAKAEYQHAMTLDPQNIGSKYKLGVALRRGRDFDAATKQFEEVSRVDPEYPGLALEWGLLYEETGQTQLALQMYNEARKKAPNDVDLKLRVGSTLVVSGHAKTAVPLLREVLLARPESGEANHFLGRALLVVHTNLAESLRLLKRATEIDPNRAEYFLYLGWAANDAGQPLVAGQALKRALELDKNLGDIYWQRGVLAQKSGATLDALAELKIALEKRPSRYEAYATMALCYQDQADWDAAEAAWRKAIAGNGDIAEWRYRLGKILVQKGDRGASTPELAKAVELAEKEEGAATPAWLHDAHFLLGEALRGSDPGKALVHYQRFLELAPTDNAYRVDAERAVATLKKPGEP